MSEQVNQRNRERKQLDQLLTLELCDPSRLTAMNEHLEVKGVDISSGGIGIATGRFMCIREVVKVIYPIDSDAISVPVYSEVVWSVAGKGGCRAGLRFLM